MARTGYHYIPRPDGNFDAFVAQYFEQVDAWWSSTGLDKSVLDPLKDAVLAWNSAYPAHTAAQAAAEGARRAKDAARAEVERQLRPITNFLQSYPTMTDADRATFGITVR
ncbi:MAG: hypothetical protein Q8L55_07135, partial [Phycisphaerales bacterium]|nr:hypothetical protein [Phycisphaerales bacterium]